MLEDYRIYLTNVRNNLIQCGVEFPISPLNTYSETFFLGLQLDEVLWYHHVLAVSGSDEALSGCMFPLRGYFKEKMRQRFYEDFRSFLQDYKKISTTFNILNGYTGNVQSVISDNEEIDLFGEEIKGAEEKEDEVVEEKEVVTPNAFLNFINSKAKEEEDIEDEELLEEEEDIEEEVEAEEDFIPVEEIDDSLYVSHGVYLDEIVEEEVNEDEELREEDIEEGCEDGYALHGVYLDELDYSEDNKEYDEDGFEIVDEGEYEDEGEDEDFEDEEDSEDGKQYDEYGFEIVDEGEYEDEEDIEDEEDEYNEDDFDSSEEVAEVKPAKPSTKVAEEKDISDYIQDVVNATLTKGKRFIYKEVKKMKDT